MKIFRNILLVNLFFYFSLSANIVEPTIKELVLKIKNAPDKRKRILINQLKIRLKRMNHESRKDAMRELKKSFNTKGINRHRQRRKRKYLKNHLNHQPKFRHLQRGLKNNHQHNGQGNRNK